MTRVISKYFNSSSINKIVEAYNSDLSIYEKAYKIYEFGVYSYDLRRFFATYYNREKNNVSDELLDEIVHFYEVCEKEGIVEEAKYVYGVMGYYINYPYSKFIIESYIDSSSSWMIESFFDEYGIDKYIFSYCVKSVNEFNVDLYNKFKKVEIQKKRRLNSYYTLLLKDVAEAIKNGNFRDGTEMTQLEFFKRIPFTGVETSYIELMSFISKHLPNERKTFFDFINKNGFVANDFVSVKRNCIDEYDSRQPRSLLYGLSHDEIFLIHSYIESENIPSIRATYKIVKDKYIKGEISFNDLKQKEKRKSYTIIPHLD